MHDFYSDKNKIISKIQYYHKKLSDEEQEHGGYENWYNELEIFRECLLKFVNKNKGNVYAKNTLLKNGHILDHHVLGYFAPLDFKRIGFGIYPRTPSEQLTILSEDLKKKGIRFIYVPLPSKGSLYPEYVINNKKLKSYTKTIPQWRKMTKELLSNGVEVIDIYDEMLKEKDNGDLYSKGHHISLFASQKIGNLIAKHIRETSEIYNTTNISLEKNKELFYFPKLEILRGRFIRDSRNPEVMQGTKIIENTEWGIGPYLGFNKDKTIQVIGNCNLQEYEYTGAGVVPHIAYNLKTEVSYIGRYLPFSSIEGPNLLLNGDLSNTKVLIYVGFPSAAFVRAPRVKDMWAVEHIRGEVFME